MRRTLSTLALLLTVVVALAGLTTAPAVAEGSSQGAGLPPLPTSPLGDPPGANNWKCKPTKARPNPVILVHGTFGDRKNLLEKLSRSIKAKGFCVFSLDYGNRGTGEIAHSARQLKAYVNRVLKATGAKKVSFVGHSQGGMMPRYYIKFLGGKNKVDDMVGLSPSNHGTNLTGGTLLNKIAGQVVGVACPACNQQGTGSAFLRRLNAGDETPGRVSYTNVTTRYDEVVIPHTSGYLKGPRTTNLTIQNLCPLDTAEHLLIPMSNTAIAVTLNALTRKGPADPKFRPAC